MRSMVVGAIRLTQRRVWPRAPTTTLRAVPLPVPGRITYICTRTPAMNTRPK